MKATIVADRLYGISMRPQELALYGERVRCEMRYQPIFDDADEVTATHFKLLVLELSAEVPAGEELGEGGGELQLVKCGWELELRTAEPCRVGTLAELPEELPRALGRVAATVNDLAERAGIDPPLPASVVADLVREHRSLSADS